METLCVHKLPAPCSAPSSTPLLQEDAITALRNPTSPKPQPTWFYKSPALPCPAPPLLQEDVITALRNYSKAQTTRRLGEAGRPLPGRSRATAPASPRAARRAPGVSAAAGSAAAAERKLTVLVRRAALSAGGAPSPPPCRLEHLACCALQGCSAAWHSSCPFRSLTRHPARPSA